MFSESVGLAMAGLSAKVHCHALHLLKFIRIVEKSANYHHYTTFHYSFDAIEHESKPFQIQV